MITKEQATKLIIRNSSKYQRYDFANDMRLLSKSEIEMLSEAIVDIIQKNEEEWEELVKLKTENATLKAENQVYKSFLLSANYKIPQSAKRGKKED